MFSLLSAIVFTNTIYLIFGKLISNSDNYNLKNFSNIAINGFIYLSFLALLINFIFPLNMGINTLVIVSIFIFFFFKKKED